MPPKKGKEGTKGQKQILEENKETLKFYLYMALAANAAYLTVSFLLFELFTTFNILMFFVTSTAYICSYQFMAYMARSKHSETGQLLDAGVDLNLEGGIAEEEMIRARSKVVKVNSTSGNKNVKDIIILTAGTQVLSLISNYFWFLLLLIPGRGGYFLWSKILSPYFFQEAPSQEIDEKKQKKLERKMRRQH